MRRSRGEDAYGAVEPAADLVMNTVDAIDNPLRVLRRAACQLEHGPDRASHAPEIAARTAVEPAVVTDGRRDQRMRELQQHGAPPAEQHYRLAVDLSRHRTGGKLNHYPEL